MLELLLHRLLYLTVLLGNVEVFVLFLSFLFRAMEYLYDRTVVCGCLISLEKKTNALAFILIPTRY